MASAPASTAAATCSGSLNPQIFTYTATSLTAPGGDRDSGDPEQPAGGSASRDRPEGPNSPYAGQPRGSPGGPPRGWRRGLAQGVVYRAERRVHQAGAVGDDGGLDPVAQPQLVHGGGDVGLDRGDADA